MVCGVISCCIKDCFLSWGKVAHVQFSMLKAKGGSAWCYHGVFGQRDVAPGSVLEGQKAGGV